MRWVGWSPFFVTWSPRFTFMKHATGTWYLTLYPVPALVRSGVCFLKLNGRNTKKVNSMSFQLLWNKLFKRTPKILKDAYRFRFKKFRDYSSFLVQFISPLKNYFRKKISPFFKRRKKKSTLSLKNVRDSSSLDTRATCFSIEKLYLFEGWTSFFVLSYVRAMNY